VRQCECELDHARVGTHPALHLPSACASETTEALESDYGRFTLCAPCAGDAVAGGHYRRLIELIDIEVLMKHEPVACVRDAQSERDAKTLFRCPMCAGKSWHDMNATRDRRVVCDGIGRAEVR
jgi:hypothetical protein